MVMKNFQAALAGVALALAPATAQVRLAPEQPAPPAAAAGAGAQEAPQEAPDVADLRQEIARLRKETARLRSELDALRRERGAGAGGWTELRPPHELFRGFDFRGLEERLRDLESRFGALGAIPAIPLPPAGAGGKSVMVQRSSDGGIKVEIRSVGEDGEEKVETYEAASPEELEKEHPGLLSEHGIHLGDGHPMIEEWMKGLPGVEPLVPSPFFGGEAVAGDRLGVYVEVPDAEKAKALGLEEGQGLVVNRIEGRTLAARMGVKAGDVLLTINGETITGPETIREALKGANAEDTITVKVRRGDEELELKATKAPRRGARRSV